MLFNLTEIIHFQTQEQSQEAGYRNYNTISFLYSPFKLYYYKMLQAFTSSKLKDH